MDLFTVLACKIGDMLGQQHETYDLLVETLTAGTRRATDNSNTDPPYNAKVEARSNNSVAAELSSFTNDPAVRKLPADRENAASDVARGKTKVLSLRAMQYLSGAGENLLDLFGGSASTLIGSEQTSRARTRINRA